MPDSASPAHFPRVSFPEPAHIRSRDIIRLALRCWPFVRPYKRHLLRLALTFIPGVVTALVGLLLVRVFFDVVGNGQPLTAFEAWILRLPISASRQDVLWHACILTGIEVLIGTPLAFFALGYAVWILQRIANLFRVNLYTRLQELTLGFHAEEKIGDAIFRMFQDSAAISAVITGLVLVPVRSMPYLIGSLIWLAIFNYAIALVALLILPAYVVLAWQFSGPLRRRFLAAREAAAQATSRIEETLASIRTVKAFGREPHERALYARENWDAFIAARRARMLNAGYRVASNLMRGLAYALVIYLGARQALTGTPGGIARAAISLGLFQGSIVVFAGMTGSARSLTVLWGDLQDVGVALARVFQMLDRVPERALDGGRELPATPHSSLRFEAVSFGYPSRTAVLNDVEFDAQVGEVTMIAGPSGSGKTTIASLILRFVDPSGGRILLDGRDIARFDLAAWRAMFSVVLQENPLFTASLRDNVAYGRAAASTEEIATACAIAGLGAFIRSLPAGLDTMLGEKGAKVSTGQAQRIGLARALIRGAPILILDEPTSALDIATEEQVMRRLVEWLRERPDQRMIIMMTHRRSAAAFADRIYRVADGRVAPVDRSEFEPAQLRESLDG